MLALALFFGVLAGMVAALVLVIRGVGLVVRWGGRSPAGRLRAVALIVGAGSVAVYAWGLFCLGMAVLDAEDGGTDSSPVRPCREAGAEVAAHVVGYGVGLVPLGFECRLAGGGSHTTASVPAYVNPGTAVLGLTGAVCAVLSAGAAGRSSRRETERLR